jgi:hypothetical protein
MNEQWIIAIGTNAFILLVSLWGFSLRITWKAGEAKADVNETISAHADNDAHEFFKIRQEMSVNDHNFAEVVSALKQRVSDVQLETSRTYVDHDGLREAVKLITENITMFRTDLTMLRADLREDFKQMEKKIDSKLESR